MSEPASVSEEEVSVTYRSVLVDGLKEEREMVREHGFRSLVVGKPPETYREDVGRKLAILQVVGAALFGVGTFALIGQMIATGQQPALSLTLLDGICFAMMGLGMFLHGVGTQRASKVMAR